MAMSGALVTFGQAIDIGSATIFEPLWSENVAAGSATNQRAKIGGTSGRFIFRVKANASGEMYAVAGQNPDASQSTGSTPDTARSHINASAAVDLPAADGDKVSVANA